MLSVWGALASPAATFLAGCTSLLCLFYFRRHVDRSGELIAANIIFAATQGAVLYILLITIAFHWLGQVPMSKTLTDGFGQERLAWVFYGMVADLLVRMLQMHYPKK